MDNQRFQFVPREKIHGNVEGVDFGYNFWVVARSPMAMLCWSAGTAYTSGRQTQYGPSTLYAFPCRIPRPGNIEYKCIGPCGGRLTMQRIISLKYEIDQLFMNDLSVFEQVCRAVNIHRTLLIEGGGPPLCPEHRARADFDAYMKWRELPYKGFYNHELLTDLARESRRPE